MTREISRPTPRNHIGSKAYLASMQAIDIGTTEYFLHAGSHEQNPAGIFLLNHGGEAGLALAKIAGTGFVLWSMGLLEKRDHKKGKNLAGKFLFAINLWYTLGMATNVWYDIGLANGSIHPS